MDRDPTMLWFDDLMRSTMHRQEAATKPSEEMLVCIETFRILREVDPAPLHASGHSELARAIIKAKLGLQKFLVEKAKVAAGTKHG